MMACGLSKSLGFSSSLKKQQGIVTILGGSDCDISSNTLSAPSLRRTFSADLSSKTWFLQNGSSPMKRVSSSEKLRAFGTTETPRNSDDETEEVEEDGSKSGFDIWAQIQQDKKEKDEKVEAGDVWSSILTEKKKKETDSVPPPYVHPLMKRASSLSEKSLEICTESLGSETGCEVFSFSSETGDSEVEKEEMNLVINVTEVKVEQETEHEVEAEIEVVQEAITVTPNELPKGSFPPPIRSLSSQSGTSLHMKTRRDNGRLVLEAVSMPSHNNFSAKRQDGRLLLTFAEISEEPSNEVDMEDEIDAEIEWFNEEEEEEEEDEEEEPEEPPNEFVYKPSGLMYKLAPKPIGPITVHRLAHKPIGVPKRNSRWPEPETKSDLSPPLVHSLPPRPRVAQLARSTKPPSTVDDTVGAACFNTLNTCDYFWKPTNVETRGPNTKPQFQAQKIVNGHDGWINGCKERRRSLLSMEPFCIATS